MRHPTLGHFFVTLLTLVTAVGALPETPEYFKSPPSTPPTISIPKIQRELGPQLSLNSLIFGPSDPRWPVATHRYQLTNPPNIQIVVQPAQESDVSKIIKYCNRNSIPFMVVNTGHGFTYTLGKFKGLQIDMKLLTKFQISSDKKSAFVQGGVYAWEVMRTLDKAGYITATTSSNCPSVIGPALGGGHGRVEGLYGLVSDNFISLNVVLADGSTLTDVSSKNHPDLFWALKGAGHNFAVITSFQIKIYPRRSNLWHWHNYYWTADKRELVLSEMSKLQFNSSVLPLFTGFLTISYNFTHSSTEPTLWYSFVWNGSPEEAEAVLAPFNAIPALDQYQGDLPYPEIMIPQAAPFFVPCGSFGANFSGATGFLTKINLTVEKKIYDLFKAKCEETPELKQSARLFYEGYADKGIKALDDKSSAYPHRERNHLVFFMAVAPTEGLKAAADSLGEKIWKLWDEGEGRKKLAVYVNYTIGKAFETLESVYGYDGWRLEKLKKLKRRYDPGNKFTCVPGQLTGQQAGQEASGAYQYSRAPMGGQLLHVQVPEALHLDGWLVRKVGDTGWICMKEAVGPLSQKTWILSNHDQAQKRPLVE
ncbi:hypothetical protein QBC38DRAFT_522121 [Podospora fimiseda]|uniref:FAD-binding PCMH-type domain-containing protein n=1 Tax=Podospora fimiseda TaxID=252190 RepID=A0AAN6YMI3_9PEZI|nr:hypothetical protein QBC38DRAFT_522121 [Podospora fimiseda]